MFYPRLPLLAYPPEMNGTTTCATDCLRTNRYDGLHGVHYCHDSTPQRRAPMDDSGRLLAHAFAALAGLFIRPEPSPATFPQFSSCSESSPAW
jgi:hypothetical protein